MRDHIDLGECARSGFDFVRDSIRLALDHHVLHPEHDGLYLMVLDGTRPFNPGGSLDEAIDEALLMEYVFNDGAKFKPIARGKAVLSWETRMDSVDAVNSNPTFLKPGRAKYQGAVYYRGIVVAASGVKGLWDQTASMLVAVATHGFVMQQRTEIEANPDVDVIVDKVSINRVTEVELEGSRGRLLKQAIEELRSGLNSETKRTILDSEQANRPRPT